MTSCSSLLQELCSRFISALRQEAIGQLGVTYLCSKGTEAVRHCDTLALCSLISDSPVIPNANNIVPLDTYNENELGLSK